MRDHDTEILLQSGLLCAAESNASMKMDVHSFTLSIQLSCDGLNVNLRLVCPVEQSNQASFPVASRGSC
ncbi:hypothetical protein DPMN_118330 [Dreissena polymorpha]|uniref:Uncharacterized protein n=1 Tax=Dreissena polymorpha TaxID=45954 RepID=A0A9D4GH68_DREPO|nr:hypothetical protein DPMN_118330 [Dreissena polymorpha]